jgi:FAD/FMN-containing dehydrogenase
MGAGVDGAELLRGGDPDLAAESGEELETSEWPGDGLDFPRTSPRRRFLAVAGLAAGAVPLSGLMRTGPGAPDQPARPGVTPGTADWEALRRALSTHKLIRPGERSYSAAKELFDPRFDSKRPAGIAYCAGNRDVRACLAFIRKFGLPVAARSGGHSYGGWSSTTGLIVDVTALNSFRVSGGSVVVGTGTRLIDMYNRLAAHGLAVPGGSCATVGVAGLTLGGGVGVLGRAFGLTSDNLQSLQLVTADGTVRTCNHRQNSDLFWACRGGGGGNFGIATSFTFRTHHLTQLVQFFLSWPWSRAARVVAGWQSWAPSQPDALWSNLHMTAAQRGGTPVIQVGGTYLGSVAGCKRLLSRLYRAVGSAPVNPNNVFLSSYRNAMLIEAGCSGLSVSECHLSSQTKNGRLPRVPSFAKSDFFTRRIPTAGIHDLVAGIERMRGVRGAAGGVGAVAFDAFGGALNRVSATATAFVHRDSLFLAQYSTSWNEGGSAAGVARQHAWLRSFYATAHRHASGQAYQNYEDPDLTNWQQAYYGRNYTRLAQVKAKYDPNQVFKFPQGITPS